MTRAIRWDLIEQNYDQMIKFATAIRVGTASADAILRRFTRNATHPVYQAMLEVGRAQRTIFVAGTSATVISSARSRRASTSWRPGTASTR